MQHVYAVDRAEAFLFPAVGGDKVLLAGIGKVRTSGWSGIRLSPRFYINPPSDGLWDIDFYGVGPTGTVLTVFVPVAATIELGVPDWLKGFRLHAESGFLEVMTLSKATRESVVPDTQSLSFHTRRNAIVNHRLATYEDSWQVIGHCSWFSVKMKKLVHELVLVVEGPDEGKIRACISEATGAGLVAAILAVYATGGGALSAAVSAFIGQLTACLGDGFTIKVDDKSEWVEWCT